jgi:hypothetical protein
LFLWTTYTRTYNWRTFLGLVSGAFPKTTHDRTWTNDTETQKHSIRTYSERKAAIKNWSGIAHTHARGRYVHHKNI